MVNVTKRFNWIIFVGFFLELTILIFVLIGLCSGRWTRLSNFLGVISVGWFVWLIFGRYDHYGKVCSGDYLEGDEESNAPFKNLLLAGRLSKLYILAIWILVGLLFISVVLYSCFNDTRRPQSQEKEEKLQ